MPPDYHLILIYRQKELFFSLSTRGLEYLGPVATNISVERDVE
ncbi:MAG: hypothetical protein JW384_00824 [Nitrosomonadaceae bacterium]|nr:hypothetical protein [Nitrosomonadaceae bacterium]